MKCPKCNTNIPNGSLQCPVCGCSLSTGATGGTTSTYRQAQTAQNVTGNPNQGTYQGGSVNQDIIVDPSERVISSLKNSMATSFMAGNGFSKTEIFFTNKRFYAKYKDISVRKGNGNVDAIIDLQEITGTLLRQQNPIDLIIRAIVWLIAGLVGANAIHPVVFVIGLILAGICVFRWYFERTMVLDISFQGDRINVALQRCAYVDADRFHKELRRYLAQIKNS